MNQEAYILYIFIVTVYKLNRQPNQSSHIYYLFLCQVNNQQDIIYNKKIHNYNNHSNIKHINYHHYKEYNSILNSFYNIEDKHMVLMMDSLHNINLDKSMFLININHNYLYLNKKYNYYYMISIHYYPYFQSIHWDNFTDNFMNIGIFHYNNQHTNYNMQYIICKESNIKHIHQLHHLQLHNMDLDMKKHITLSLNSNNQQLKRKKHIKQEYLDMMNMMYYIICIEIDINSNRQVMLDMQKYNQFHIKTNQDNKINMLNLNFSKSNNLNYKLDILIHLKMFQKDMKYSKLFVKYNIHFNKQCIHQVVNLHKLHKEVHIINIVY